MLVTKPEALKGDVGEPNKFLGQTPGLRRTSFSGKPRAMRVDVVEVAVEVEVKAEVAVETAIQQQQSRSTHDFFTGYHPKP